MIRRALPKLRIPEPTGPFNSAGTSFHVAWLLVTEARGTVLLLGAAEQGRAGAAARRDSAAVPLGVQAPREGTARNAIDSSRTDTFFSHALAGGGSLAEVRDAAGHANVAITSGYLHVAVDEDAAVGVHVNHVWIRWRRLRPREPAKPFQRPASPTKKAMCRRSSAGIVSSCRRWLA